MHALTHLPSPNLEQGLRTHVTGQSIDYDLAVQQHSAYCRLLRDCGVTVRTLATHPELPDGVFIEDTAVVLEAVAILATMGTAARRAELAGIEPELRKYRPLQRLELPARLEGGDILRVGRALLVGLSARTDKAGVQALAEIVEPLAYRVLPVRVPGCLHLKTACTALPDGTLLVNPAWINPADLGGYELLPVPETEPWGANVLLVGNCVCVAAEHELTAGMLQRRGFELRTVPLSEFAKAEGGMTCLSLLFD